MLKPKIKTAWPCWYRSRIKGAIGCGNKVEENGEKNTELKNTNKTRLESGF